MVNLRFQRSRARAALSCLLFISMDVSAYWFSGLKMREFASNPDFFSLEYRYWRLVLEQERNLGIACYPDGLGIKELEQITIEWMEANPVRLNQDGELVIHFSHFDAFGRRSEESCN